MTKSWRAEKAVYTDTYGAQLEGLEQVRNPSGKSAEVAASDRRKGHGYTKQAGKNTITKTRIQLIQDDTVYSTIRYILADNVTFVDCHGSSQWIAFV